MGVLDIILGALILFGIVRGFMKGLFIEVASLVALIAGVFGAIHFSNFTGSFLESRVDWDEKTIRIAALAITFVIIVVAIAISGKALTKLADFASLGILNKLLGAIFGGLKIAMILSVILIVFDKMNRTIPFASQENLEDSAFYNSVKGLAPLILPIILSDKDDDSEDTLEENDTV